MILPVHRQEITVRKWPFIIFIALYSIFFYFVFESKETDHSLKWIVAASLLFVVVLFHLLISRKIIIDTDGITQQMVMGKQKQVKWKAVNSSKINWEFTIHTAELSWEIKSTSGKMLRFNPSYYSRKNLKIIAETLLNKCNQADLDKRISQIAEGKFPWYIF